MSSMFLLLDKGMFIYGRDRDFYLSHGIETSRGAHPASYPRLVDYYKVLNTFRINDVLKTLFFYLSISYLPRIIFRTALNM